MRKTPCFLCDNAKVNTEITSENDLSYHVLGSVYRGYRLLFRSGNNKPTAILIEGIEDAGWVTIGEYVPKYCPNCGRKLLENM